MDGVSFAGARLSNVSFQDVSLSGVDFAGAQLHNVRVLSTDPLTGLTVMPVLLLRLGDALRRARRRSQTPISG